MSFVFGIYPVAVVVGYDGCLVLHMYQTGWLVTGSEEKNSLEVWERLC